MLPIERARLLAQDIRESEEYRDFERQKELIASDDAINALLKEYTRMQMGIQLQAATGQAPDQDAVTRFNQLSALLYADSRTGAYLTAQIRLQKMAAEVLQVVGDAAGLNEQMLL